MVERGVIRNRHYATQIRDFSGLRYGNITPTDGDFEIEYQNICWVFGELKHCAAALPNGQRLALERKCDDMSNVKPTLLIVASHNTDGDIDVANTTVTEFRFERKWRMPANSITTKELIDRFLKWAKVGKRLREGKV